MVSVTVRAMVMVAVTIMVAVKVSVSLAGACLVARLAIPQHIGMHLYPGSMHRANSKKWRGQRQVWDSKQSAAVSKDVVNLSP